MRWILVVLVMVVAGAVALWPRGDDTGTAGSATGPSPDLVAVRAKAALPPCPAPAATGAGVGAAGSPRLSGLQVNCLADGTPMTVGEALGGGPVLVNVWGWWCEPCKEELPLLAAYAAEPGAARVVTVSLYSRPEDALGLLSALGVRLPTVLDTNQVVEKVLNAPGLPASYLVDEKGEVRLIDQPRVFGSLDEIRAAVRRYGSPGGGR